VPGVLKNALDTASRPYGKNVWTSKPAGILSASMGAAGGAMAQQHLRNILVFLDVPAMAAPEAFIHVTKDFFDGEGNFASPDTKKFLQGWMDKYVAWVRKHAA
jgi:chromate reductase